MGHIAMGLECCGAVEYTGLNADNNTPEKILVDLFDGDGYYEVGTSNPEYCVVFMTEVVAKGQNSMYGDSMFPAFKAFIEKHKLGGLVSAPRAKRNPNSGNMVRGHVFTPNFRKIKAWLNENDKNWAQARRDARAERRRYQW